MRILSPPSNVIALAVLAIGTAVGLELYGWPHPHQMLQLPALVLAAILISVSTRQSVAGRDRAAMPPVFVVDFLTLLLFGTHAATFVAASGAITEGLLGKGSTGTGRGAGSISRFVPALLNVATVVAATQVAGFAYGSLARAANFAVWPWIALPVAAAVIGYCAVKHAAAHVIVPFLTKQPVDRTWARRLAAGYPAYVIGASLAVALTALIERGLWQILAAASVPLYLICRAYCSLKRVEDVVLESLDEGTCVLDARGKVTLWNEALGQITGCPREKVIGRAFVSAVPGVNNTALPRAIQDAMREQTSRTVEQLRLQPGAKDRILHVRVLPVAGGVTLLWHDVTERVQAEQALKRSEERLSLAAEGANDGLWEWDLRSQEFYHSGRWRAMIGVETPFDIGQPAEWLDRVHPDDIGPLKETLDAHLSGRTERFEYEHRIKHEDGTYRRFLCRGMAVRNSRGRAIRIAGSLTDTTEQAKAQEQLRTAAFVDPLTGLCNRAVFVEGLGKRLEVFKQRPQDGRFAVLYLDLDRFKIVNDSLGHLVGDELLIAVSRRLETCLRQGDALARLGGDEFAILLDGLTNEQQANAIAFRIQEKLGNPFAIGGREVFTSASIGIACGTVHYTSPDEIMRDADTAMYHAKARGKARHELFDADMHARTRDRLGLENDLRRAVAANDFEVRYQPIVTLTNGMCVGFESLIRWTRNGEPVSPAMFIPMAEELGLIEPIGTWVLQQACRTFADWQRRYPSRALDYITVNVSSRQLVQQNFLSTVEQAVKSAGLKPGHLRLEITETALMDSPGHAAEVLQELRRFGAKIYLDDFGTGYSSLSHLHKLPVDALKIDRSFVRSLLIPERPAIVESILALARTLNTSVVAEGIETDVEARELERLGCTHAQGFLFSKPLSMRDAEKVISDNLPLGPKESQQSRVTVAVVGG
jgi:diguanylate cyclase (GGDEF)-like protein/PAS domain S-box-containing protein